VSRQIKFSAALLEATDQCMARDPRVYVMGLGVTDPKGTFGTTLGLEAKYGPKRVMDIPTSENAMTGVAIGSALVGMRPIMTHQRVDFAILSLDQIINNAAKWHYMFGGRTRVPLVIRLMMGRGWGQGPQHSQSLEALFAHIPGLTVVVPATAYDAKGLLISAIEDDNPVIFLEHRWLHDITGAVPAEMYRVPLGKARVARAGRDVTIVSTSYMTLEALRAGELLAADGIEAEVIDLRTIKPLDSDLVLESIRKTGRLVVADGDWRTLGLGAEIIALAAEHLHGVIKSSPRRIAWPDAPVPSSSFLAAHYYPRAVHIINAVRTMMMLPERTEAELGIEHQNPLDVPDASFRGPF
jgi:pyruvate/2-oxoglutarate/acetoin dehydrogenase E1 component